MLEKVRSLFSRPASAESIYDNLLLLLDGQNLGFGYDVRDLDNKAHWPSAYGLIASAEIRRYQATRNEVARQNASLCANWLSGNIGCASTAAPVWGVPYPRKIWMDDKPYPAGTGFAIPTMHAIQGLCEIAEAGNQDKAVCEHQLLLDASFKAADYFAKNCFDNSKKGVSFWYSPLKSHSYHVTNAIAMVAGQVQRMYHFFPDQDQLGAQADSAVMYLLDSRVFDKQGYGWRYFGDRIPENKQNRQNDLLHDAFVCHGLLEYKRYGGKHAQLIKDDELYACMERFIRNGKVFEYPLSEQNQKRRKHYARLWGMSHALYVTSRIEGKESSRNALSHSLMKNFANHYFSNGQLLGRRNGEDVSSHVREVAHTLFGLSRYIWR